MNNSSIAYSLKMGLSFTDWHEAEVVFGSIYPDIVRERFKNLTVDLSMEDSSIRFNVSSSSYAKFRGFISNLLRLIIVSVQIFRVVNHDEL